ncbi:hypothetical protein NDN08_008098 [Rhodosorus marinus]|uniref:Ubiquinone biosynthesis protein COQ4 homolog, mitochondrial n=1 Tax=Rhodosorus marinus TaxID=101924 RepID=A0AAV8V310_9RHOD|nr:hypothetical protein NDN08_008098 [Rhodosorus marinus]
MSYHQYQPLSQLGRASVAIGSALLAVRNPARGDLVAALGETTGSAALQRLLRRMEASAEGSLLLKERAIISSETVSPKRLKRECPEGTFGAAYADFMLKRNFSPDDRSIVRFVESEDLAYVMLRYRQVHDFWHVLVDLPPSILGELALKWFEWAHTGLPSTLLSASFASFRLSTPQQLHLANDLTPWALDAGAKCANLLSVHYETLFGKDLDELRGDLKLTKAPLSEEFR